MEKSLRDCAKDCVNKDECVVLTGHSQGGAIAAIAAVYMADLNPYVITFGQPPVLKDDTATSLAQRIQLLEHEHYPKVIEKLLTQQEIQAHR